MTSFFSKNDSSDLTPLYLGAGIGKTGTLDPNVVVVLRREHRIADNITPFPVVLKRSTSPQMGSPRLRGESRVQFLLASGNRNFVALILLLVGHGSLGRLTLQGYPTSR